jgi:hypothetical protein
MMPLVGRDGRARPLQEQVVAVAEAVFKERGKKSRTSSGR